MDEGIGVISVILLIAATDRISTWSGHQFLVAGFVYLVAIAAVSAKCGTRAGLIACLVLVGYVWLIFARHISVYPGPHAKFLPNLISSAIIYPLFAIVFGVVYGKLRLAATREWDARETAEKESEHRRMAEAELWASEEMTRLIVDSSLDAIIGVSTDCQITMWNPNAEQLFGWSQAESIGKLAGERIVAADGPSDWMESLIDGSEDRRSVEAIVKTKSGEDIVVDLRFARQRIESGPLTIVFARDISERRRTEQHIRELNASLEARVAERTAQLKAANDELVGFTYSVSHDLRAPLRAIVGNSRIVLEEASESLDPAVAERLARLESNALRMAELIENLLQFARIGQATVTPRQIDVTEMAESIASDLRSSKDGDVQIEPCLSAEGDPEMVRMLLHNLMENAWKYVAEGERPQIAVGRDVTGAFFVRDNGIGFDMRYVDKIWQPFERLHRDAEYPGTGIGLANAKRVVERHGGRIWAESAPGSGTSIYFELSQLVRPAPRGKQPSMVLH